MKKKFTEKGTFKEFKVLAPYYIGAFVLLCAVSAVLCIAGAGDYTLFTGALAGTVLSSGSFVLMGLTAERSLYMGEKSAKLALNGGYAARYIAMFIILGALMYFKLVNPVTALLPLFVPKIGYTVAAFKEKSEF